LWNCRKNTPYDNAYVDTIVPITEALIMKRNILRDVPTQAFYPQLIVQALTKLWSNEMRDLPTNQD